MLICKLPSTIIVIIVIIVVVTTIPTTMGWWYYQQSGVADTLHCAGTSENQLLKDPITNSCVLGTSGWKITGYFLPLEGEYPNSKGQQYYVLGTRSDGSFDYKEDGKTFHLQHFRKDFIRELKIEGAGETLAAGHTEKGQKSNILQTWKGDTIHPRGVRTTYYHYEPCAKTSSGLCLPIMSPGNSTIDSSIDEPAIIVAASLPQMHGLTQRDLELGVLEYGDLIRIPNIPGPWDKATYYVADTGSSWTDKHIDIFTGRGKAAKLDAEKVTLLDYSGIVLYLGNYPINSPQPPPVPVKEE